MYSVRKTQAIQTVPRFFLYGEAERDAETHFLHVETIPSRSQLHDWHIAPHRHSNLFQFLIVARGGGQVRIDTAVHAIDAPMVVGIPPGVVHGFEFDPDIEGWVISVAESYAAEIASCAPNLIALNDVLEPSILRLSRSALAEHRLIERCREIDQEFRWSALGRVAAIAANLQLLFLGIARLRHEHEETALAAGDDAALFARFRALVESWYREHRALVDFTKSLGVTEKRLAQACHRAVNRTPLEVIHDRIAIEAKRSLLYTSMTISEVGYSLGFQDPAYFSRFFTRAAGLAPRAFLKQERRKKS
jgi:AraC family transcriptional regulator, transcriptional activator of pobA